MVAASGDWEGMDLGFATLYICKQVLGFGLDIHGARVCIVSDNVQLVTFFESVTKNPSQINRFLVVNPSPELTATCHPLLPRPWRLTAHPRRPKLPGGVSAATLWRC